MRDYEEDKRLFNEILINEILSKKKIDVDTIRFVGDLSRKYLSHRYDDRDMDEAIEKDKAK